MDNFQTAPAWILPGAGEWDGIRPPCSGRTHMTNCVTGPVAKLEEVVKARLSRRERQSPWGGSTWRSSVQSLITWLCEARGLSLDRSSS